MQKGLGHVLDLYLDPWENIHSETKSQVAKEETVNRRPVVEYYGCRDCHYCMVLGKVTHCDVITAHLWPRSTMGQGLTILELSPSDVNNPRNFLRLHKSFESALEVLVL